MAIAVSRSIAAAPARADDRPPALPGAGALDAVGGPGVSAAADARIVVRHADRTLLRGEGRTLAEDLAQLLHRPVDVTTRRGASARTGDIVMGRTASARSQDEGYRLRVGRAFAITADDDRGVLRRTHAAAARAGGHAVPRGRGRDVPVYAERGLMIDVGRRYYRRRWLPPGSASSAISSSTSCTCTSVTTRAFASAAPRTRRPSPNRHSPTQTSRHWCASRRATTSP
jgi:hexosaminidase